MKSPKLKVNELDNFSIKKGFRVCAKRKDGIKKILKIVFQKNKPDFYLLLPYFNTTEYDIGKMTIPKGQNSLDSFNLKKNRTSSSQLPVKFSYHQDGSVHFKPTSPKSEGVSVSYKYEKIQATPIKDLTGEHIFTVQFEYLENFESLESKDSKSLNLITPISENKQSFKITCFAGNSEKSITSKYKGKNPAIVKLKNSELKKDFYLGFYFISYDNSIQNNKDKGPFLLTLVGFKKNLGLSKDQSLLYSYAK